MANKKGTKKAETTVTEKAEIKIDEQVSVEEVAVANEPKEETKVAEAETKEISVETKEISVETKVVKDEPKVVVTPTVEVKKPVSPVLPVGANWLHRHM